MRTVNKKKEVKSNLSLLVLTSPCLELSCTAAATASVHQFYDPTEYIAITQQIGREAKLSNKKTEVFVPSPHWLPSMNPLPFSFFALPRLVSSQEGREKNHYRQRTEVLRITNTG